MHTIAGMPQTKLLIAELILTKVSIISPYHIFNGKRKRERDCTKIHHVLCPTVFLSPEPVAGFKPMPPGKGKTNVKIITKQQATSILVKMLTRIMH